MITIANSSQQSNIRFEIALKSSVSCQWPKVQWFLYTQPKPKSAMPASISKELDMIIVNIQCPQEWNHPVVLWVHLIQEFLKHYHIIMYFFKYSSVVSWLDHLSWWLWYHQQLCYTNMSPENLWLARMAWLLGYRWPAVCLNPVSPHPCNWAMPRLSPDSWGWAIAPKRGDSAGKVAPSGGHRAQQHPLVAG